MTTKDWLIVTFNVSIVVLFVIQFIWQPFDLSGSSIKETPTYQKVVVDPTREAKKRAHELWKLARQQYRDKNYKAAADTYKKAYLEESESLAQCMGEVEDDFSWRDFDPPEERYGGRY